MTGRLRHDSRMVEPGDVYVALDGVVPAEPGWVADALARGAAEVWAPPSLVSALGMIGAPSEPGGRGDAASRIREVALSEVGELASEWYGRPSESLTVFGVTGTNGKTSTVQLLAQAWAALGHRAATVGTLGAAMHGDELTLNGFTTPPVTRLHELLAEFRDRGATHVALEVSSHALEVGRADGVAFDAVHFSNLTRDHLEFHRTMDAYAASKARIYDLPGKGPEGFPLAIGNLDDPFVRSRWSGIADLEPVGRLRVGVSSRGASEAAIRAERIEFSPTGTTFDLVDDGPDGGLVRVASPLIGRFNVDNLLAVAAVLRRIDGVPLADIAALVPALEPPNGRMWRIGSSPELPTVIVDAGHTPDAMRQALAAVADYGYDRVITVFGATGDRDPGKRPEMARIVEAGSDVVIVTDDDVHDEDGDGIVAQLLAAMTPEGAAAAIVERDRGRAVEQAIRMAAPGDVVMLLGKGHEPMQIVADHVEIPYSDIETAERVVRSLG